MKQKSKFLTILEQIVKEQIGTTVPSSTTGSGSTPPTPAEAEQSGQAAAGAAQQAGTKTKEAIAAANQALMAAIQMHPELQGDFNKLTPDFWKNLGAQ